MTESLAANIRDGQLKAGDKLPADAEVMVRFDVRRTAVRQSSQNFRLRVWWKPGMALGRLPPEHLDNFRIDATGFAPAPDGI